MPYCDGLSPATRIAGEAFSVEETARRVRHFWKAWQSKCPIVRMDGAKELESM
jgi:hypothetical protein